MMTSQNDRLVASPEATLAIVGTAEHPAIRFVQFLAAGSLAALVNLVSRYLATPVIGSKTSIVAAYILGMLVAFVLFRTLVFERSDVSVAAESYRFVIVNILALTLVWIISVTLTSAVFPAIGLSWHREDIAHFVGTCVPR